MTILAAETGVAKPLTGRLYFLDWIRILAFFLLIFYHVGMYYVSWGWHVKSIDASTTIEPLMRLSSPWRLSLLFMISGVATSFLLNKIRVTEFARQRSVRLLVPLLFGVLVIVPPQAYYEVVEKLAYAGSYTDFMQLYLHGYQGFKIDGHVLILPTWNHLWYVVYLWVYCMLLSLLMWLKPQWLECLRSGLNRVLQRTGVILIPVVYLAAVRIFMLSDFPPSNNLVWDWFNHATYLFLFLFGALIASSTEFWEQLAKCRWRSLCIAVSGWLFLLAYFHYVSDAPAWLLSAQRAVWVLLEWNAILAVCGFSRIYLQFDNSARRYLTQAVFPVYILHQTIIVVLAHHLKPAHIAPLYEGLFLVVATLTLSLLGFELIRRIAVLRPLFGLPVKTPAAAATSDALLPPVST